MATSAEYQKLLNAVANYYGSGSDAWATIIKNLGTNDAGEVAKLLKSVPGVNVYTSENGTVLDYTVRQLMDSFTSSENIGNVINSNNVPSTVGGSLTANIPSIVNKSATTGQFSGISGIGLKADTGLTATGVLSTVGVALGAVGIGAKLGKIIGDSLYTSNPDIWDDGVISAFSQLDWGKFGVALKDNVTGRLEKGILGLFGVDGDNTTMYLDENAVGYLTWYMKENNLLDSKFVPSKPTSNVVITRISSSGESDFTIGANDIKISENIYESNNLLHEVVNSYGNFISKVDSVKDDAISDINYLKHFSGYASSKSTVNGVNTKNLAVLNEKNVGLFNGNIGGTVVESSNKYVPVGRYDVTASGSFTVSKYKLKEYDNTITVLDSLWNIGNVLSDLPIVANMDENSMIYNELAKVNGLGTYIGVNGISNNSNSTQFDPTGVGSVATALGALKNQYPELWNNSIKKTVPQEDGTEDERTYLPIPIPNFKNAFDTQPTTGTPDQKNPQVNPSTTPKEEQKNLADTIAPPSTPSDDPNTGGGNSPTIIVPTQQASSLWAIYNPSLTQLNQLGSWLWSTDFIDQLLKIFNDPMQAIIGLHKVYATPSISGSGNIKVGYLDSGVPSNIVGNQYTYIDCGTVSLREYYGNTLDYSPYTTVQLYLPFIGIVSLDIADVSRSSITVKYGVDVLTGACLASVSVQRDNAGGVLYQYSGNCACQYPLSSGSYMGLVTGAIGALGSLARGNIFGTAMGIAGMHTNIEHSGGFSGNAGAMGIKKPYLIISRPQSAMNDGFPSIQGYPSNYFIRLGNCSGFIQVAECHVENISATDKELDKIKDLLKEGVIL